MKSLNEERNGILKPIMKAASACLTLTMLATGPAVFAKAPVPQSPPVVTGFSVTGTEDAGVFILDQAPLNTYTDADNDTMVLFKLVTAPINGNLFYDNGTRLYAGDVISSNNIYGLSYRPSNDFSGSDSFEFNCSDGITYADSSAIVSLQIAPTNDAPTGISLSVLALDENSPVGATVGTFTANDVDAGDSHTFTLVSGVGDDDNGSFSIVANKLQADEAFNYEIKSSYNVRVKATDDSTASVELPFIITVNNVNDKPVISIVSETVEAGSIVNFSAGKFILKFSDEDNDPLGKIKINSLPIMGTLSLGSTPVSIGDEISAADLGILNYEAPSNFIGNVSFDWNGFDGTEYADTDSRTNIRVYKDRAPGSTTTNVALTPNSSLVGSGISRAPISSGSTITGTSGVTGSGGTRPNGGGSGSTSSGTWNKTAPTTAVIAGIENPAEFMVHNNYPNPFAASTSIRYELPAEYMVTVKVFNELGTEIAVLADGIQQPGTQTLTWNPEDNLPNGQYFYNINIHSVDGTQMAFKTGVMVKIK